MQSEHKRPDKILSLQAARALACLAVFAGHCGIGGMGAWAVSVFIILSGFLMAYSYQAQTPDTGLRSCARFAIRKVRRLYPLHLLMLMPVMLEEALALLARPSRRAGVLLALRACFSITLTQAWVPSYQVAFAFNGVSWFLSTALFLYAAFPVIHRRLTKQSSRRLLWIAPGIYLAQIAVGAVGTRFSVPHRFWDAYSQWLTYMFPLFRLGDFTIGCCIGYLFARGAFSPSAKAATLCEALTAAAVFWVCSRYNLAEGVLGSAGVRFNVLFTPVSVAYVLLFALHRGGITRALTCRPLVWFGDLSGYVFLMHMVVIIYVDRLCELLFGALLPDPGRLAVSLAVTLCLSALYAHLASRRSIRSSAQSS